MDNLRDSQRAKVYDWETIHVHSRIRDRVTFKNAQHLIDHVWQGEGLARPPQAKELHVNSGAEASACRMTVCISKEDGIRSSVLLHELAHSMTSLPDGRSAQHGPRFVGMFIDLLVKYARMDRNLLEGTAKACKVEFNYKGHVL